MKLNNLSIKSIDSNTIKLTIYNVSILIPKKEFETRIKYELIGLGNTILNNCKDK